MFASKKDMDNLQTRVLLLEKVTEKHTDQINDIFDKLNDTMQIDN